jgi:hypothetical protein
MAALDLEEQEQLAQIKAWWQRYGNLVLTALTLMFLAIAGYNGWNYYQRTQATAAAQVFEGVQKLAAGGDAVGRRRAFAPPVDGGFDVGDVNASHGGSEKRTARILPTTVLTKRKRVARASPLGSIPKGSSNRARANDQEDFGGKLAGFARIDDFSPVRRRSCCDRCSFIPSDLVRVSPRCSVRQFSIAL